MKILLIALLFVIAGCKDANQQHVCPLIASGTIVDIQAKPHNWANVYMQITFGSGDWALIDYHQATRVENLKIGKSIYLFRCSWHGTFSKAKVK